MSQRRSLDNGRPPLAVSPRRLRPRRSSHSAAVLQSTQACSNSKIQVPNRTPNSGKTSARPEFQVINSDLLAMANLAEQGSPHDLIPVLPSSICTAHSAAAASPQFERGRFYNIYSVRRNERLKKKQMELSGKAEALAQDPCVAVELGKRRSARLQAEASGRKSMPPNSSVARASAGAVKRSSLRSCKEMKKAPGSVCSSDYGVDADCGTARRIITRS